MISSTRFTPVFHIFFSTYDFTLSIKKYATSEQKSQGIFLAIEQQQKERKFCNNSQKEKKAYLNCVCKEEKYATSGWFSEVKIVWAQRQCWTREKKCPSSCELCKNRMRVLCLPHKVCNRIKDSVYRFRRRTLMHRRQHTTMQTRYYSATVQTVVHFNSNNFLKMKLNNIFLLSFFSFSLQK